MGRVEGEEERRSGGEEERRSGGEEERRSGGEEGEEEKPFTSLSPQSLFSADSGSVVIVRPMILPGENHSHESYCSQIVSAPSHPPTPPPHTPLSSHTPLPSPAIVITSESLDLIREHCIRGGEKSIFTKEDFDWSVQVT